MTCIVINSLDALIPQIYFWDKTLHVSDSSSVHHQEFFTVHTTLVYVLQVCWQLASRVRTDLRSSVLILLASCHKPVSTKRVTLILRKFKSCRALLPMLLVNIPSYMNSVLRNKFLILCIYLTDSLYLRERGCEDPSLFLFSTPKGIRVQIRLRNRARDAFWNWPSLLFTWHQGLCPRICENMCNLKRIK